MCTFLGFMHFCIACAHFWCACILQLICAVHLKVTPLTNGSTDSVSVINESPDSQSQDALAIPGCRVETAVCLLLTPTPTTQPQKSHSPIWKLWRQFNSPWKPWFHLTLPCPLAPGLRPLTLHSVVSIVPAWGIYTVKAQLVCWRLQVINPGRKLPFHSCEEGTALDPDPFSKISSCMSG